MKSPITDEIRIIAKKQQQEHLQCLRSYKNYLETDEYYGNKKYFPVNATRRQTPKAIYCNIVCINFESYKDDYQMLDNYQMFFWTPKTMLFEHCGDCCNTKTYKNFVIKKIEEEIIRVKNKDWDKEQYF